MAEEITSRPGSKTGRYFHKESGAVVETVSGARGVIQADALVRVGYVYQPLEEPVEEPKEEPQEAPKKDSKKKGSK